MADKPFNSHDEKLLSLSPSELVAKIMGDVADITAEAEMLKERNREFHAILSGRAAICPTDPEAFDELTLSERLEQLQLHGTRATALALTLTKMKGEAQEAWDACAAFDSTIDDLLNVLGVMTLRGDFNQILAAIDEAA